MAYSFQGATTANNRVMGRLPCFHHTQDPILSVIQRGYCRSDIYGSRAQAPHMAATELN